MLGLDDEQELFQYVVYDTEKAKGPRVIKLDDPAPSPHKTYAPPTSLKVHLSKIDIPELKPRPEPTAPKSRSATGSGSPPTSAGVPASLAKLNLRDDNGKEKEKEKVQKKDETDKTKAKPSKKEEREREKERQKEKEREKAKKEREKKEWNKGVTQRQAAADLRKEEEKLKTRGVAR